MILRLNKINNKINDEVLQELQNLEDGNYILRIHPTRPKTKKEFREWYFQLVDIIRDHTGNDRYSIHEEFKENQVIGSTTQFNEQDWEIFIEKFKWYVFEKLDIAL